MPLHVTFRNLFLDCLTRKVIITFITKKAMKQPNDSFRGIKVSTVLSCNHQRLYFKLFKYKKTSSLPFESLALRKNLLFKLEGSTAGVLLAHQFKLFCTKEIARKLHNLSVMMTL